MCEPERYFYHSFPRFDRKRPTTETTGLEILKSISDSGFLLTPETTKWREPLSDGSFGEPWSVSQRTCSFTQLSPHELPRHSQQFGEFSIEFHLQTLRELGAMPVFYLPRASPENRLLESTAAMLMARTGEITRLLKLLAEVEEAVLQTDDKDQLLVLLQNGRQLPTRCSCGGAEDVIAGLTYRSRPIQELHNSLQGLSGLFYPAEDRRSTGLLGNYRQREWRFISHRMWHGQYVDRDLTEEEKTRLLEINRRFFGKNIEVKKGTCRRVDDCRFFQKLDGKHLLQYASRIIVPADAFEQAKKLLGDSNEFQVITVDDLVAMTTKSSHSHLRLIDRSLPWWRRALRRIAAWW